MGGRVAEELISISSRRAPNDIQVAPTSLGRWSASGACRTSSVRCTSASARVRSFWAATSATPARTTASRPPSRSTTRFGSLSRPNYDRAKKVVMENLDKLKLLAEALLEYETVDGADIDMIFTGKRLERSPGAVRTRRPLRLPPSPPRRRRGPAFSRRRGPCRTRQRRGDCAGGLGPPFRWPARLFAEVRRLRRSRASRGKIGVASPNGRSPRRRIDASLAGRGRVRVRWGGDVSHCRGFELHAGFVFGWGEVEDAGGCGRGGGSDGRGGGGLD